MIVSFVHALCPFDGLPALVSLERLELSRNTAWGSDAVVRLCVVSQYKRVHGRPGKCTSLRALDLSGNNITVLNGFRSHESIQELRLQMCPVSDDGLGELAS